MHRSVDHNEPPPGMKDTPNKPDNSDLEAAVMNSEHPVTGESTETFGSQNNDWHSDDIGVDGSNDNMEDEIDFDDDEPERLTGSFNKSSAFGFAFNAKNESLCNKKHYLYLIAIGVLGSVFVACTAAIIVARKRNDIWTTRMMRVEFDEEILQRFSGCFEATDIEHDRRVAYQSLGLRDNTTASLAYCEKTHEWIFHERDPGANPCTVNDEGGTLSRSSVTFSFDIATVFDTPWFSQLNDPISVSFIDNEQNNISRDGFFCGRYTNDGVCDEMLNDFRNQYDGGDCCASTCSNNDSCGTNVLKSAFGLDNISGIGFPNCTDPNVRSRQSRLEIHIDDVEGLESEVKQQPRVNLVCSQDDIDTYQVFSIALSQEMKNKSETVWLDTGTQCYLEIMKGEEVGSDLPSVSYHAVQIVDSSEVEIYRGRSRNSETGSARSGFIVFDKDSAEHEILQSWIKETGSIQRGLGYWKSLTRIDFPRTSIYGSIPTEVGELTSLSYMDLTDNELTGAIPSEIGLLTSLSYLDLSSNQLTGPIPSEIGLLTSLVNLELNWNSLSGPIPSEIGLLTSLSFLDLDSNKLTGAIPSEIGLLTSLSYLNLNLNKLTGAIPSEIGLMTSLWSLDLAENQLTGAIPSEIELLTSLWSLDFFSNKLTGGIPSEIGLLTSLGYFNLNVNKLTGPIPSEIGLMTSLWSLDFSNNQLTGAIPSEIELLTSLWSLDLTFNKLTGAIPSEIGLMTSLSFLILSSNQLTGAIPSEIGLLTSLSTLDLSSNQLTGAIPSEIGLLTTLRSLYSYYNILTGPIPSEIGILTSLSYLDLHGNRLNGTIPSEIGLMTSLPYLDLNFNQLTGAIPSEIGLLTSLSTLFFCNNKFTGPLPSEVGLLASLDSHWLDCYVDHNQPRLL